MYNQQKAYIVNICSLFPVLVVHGKTERTTSKWRWKRQQSLTEVDCACYRLPVFRQKQPGGTSHTGVRLTVTR